MPSFSPDDFVRRLNARFPAGFPGKICRDEPMAAHTTFRTGGPADLWVRPEGNAFPASSAAVFRLAGEEGVPVFVLGGGANLVVADRGIRGIVLDTGGWTGLVLAPDRRSVTVRSGTAGDALAETLAGEGLGGLEFLAGMPGSTGGMVWMNARAMEKSVSGVLTETEILDENRDIRTVPARAEDFGYKRSPFQGRKVLILRAVFSLEAGNPAEIRKKIDEYRRTREEKGHFRAPSAGSVFKNSREFGEPTGKIIDSLGLRGLSRGGAQVAPWHGNFIINTGGASAGDIRALVEELREKVRARRGIVLEPEILFVGDWT